MQTTVPTYDELVAHNQKLAASNDYLKHEIDRLSELLRSMQRARFSSKSESLSHPGMIPLFEQMNDETVANDEDEGDQTVVPEYTRSRKRMPLPDALPREEVLLDLADEEKQCSSCRKQMEKSHEKIAEKLHVKPAEFLVKRFVVPVYKCRCCEEVRQAKVPSHPIPKCSVTPETITHIAIGKYLDGLPLYRQEKIFLRQGVEIGRDKMSRWMIQISKKLEPLHKKMYEKLLNEGFLGMDETTLQVLKEPGRRADSKSYMVVQAREGPPGQAITLFHYEKSRSKETIGQYLEGFSGSLITDGLAGYQSYTHGRNHISHGGCLSHARRKFAEAVRGKKTRSATAKDVILLMKQVFRIEKEIKGKPLAVVLKTRQEQSKPIMEQIKSVWLERIDKIPKKSLTGAALHYLKNQWDYLCRFLDDPNLPAHNNYVEQQIRPFVVGRKSWLFSDTPEGAQASAVLYSLIVTAKANGLNPASYLTEVLSEVDTTSDIDSLLPFS